jgi:hypothetical protein
MGAVENRSSHKVWITAGNKKHCLASGETSETVGIVDGDGLLLDGRSVLFDSVRTDLGGGKVYTDGAIKVCDLGTLTVKDGPGGGVLLIAEISVPGFICRSDSAGYKTPDWCKQHPGWDIATAPLARACP